ncbi:PEP-CTERM sorting domain-containing protein [Planctomycetota bacterium]|nr:PEP-CTERM sorting domain-containing protein [Planctomycetota bacterium]
MKFQKTLLTCALIALTSIATSTTNAAELIFQGGLVSYINNLEVNGKTYNASIIISQFTQTWHPDENFNFVTGNTPTFWHDPVGAQTAVQKIMDLLGDTHQTNNVWHSPSSNFIPSDEIVVPYDSTPDNQVISYFDADRLDLTVDNITTNSHTQSAACIYATFVEVPEPTTASLLALTTLPFMLRRRRTA